MEAPRGGAKPDRGTMSPSSLGYLLPGFRRLWLQINDEATNANSESSQWIFQRRNRSHPEKAQGRDGSDAHDPARPRRDLANWSSVDELPDQAYVGRVDEEEDRRI